MSKFSSRLALILVCTLVATSAFAAPSIEVASLGDGLAWNSSFNYGEASIVVTGPNNYSHTQRIDGASSLAVALDGVLGDGAYNWEIKANSAVSEELTDQLEQARAAGEDSLVAGLKANADFTAHTFTGTFWVKGGQIHLPEAVSEIQAGGSDSQGALKAQVFATDLIVQGSGCVGFDCASSENFGSDTLRLKENNLRIHFDDTSASASFPKTDWRLVANDSTNGGAEYFAIEDATNNKTPFRVEANTPNHTLYVDSAGRVGVQTSTPAVLVHTVDGNSPTLRLEQDGSDGFTPQTWDLAGNETNFFLRDVTHSSKLPFRVKPDAPKNSLFIAADGSIGLGDETPDATVDLERDDDAQILVENTTATEGQRQLLSLVNKGKVSIRMADTTAGATNDRWDMAVDNVTSTSEFSISKVGTGVAEFKIDTSGNMTILGTLTTAGANYPDYVFDEGYELMPLDQVAAFIDENGHLPGVRSEAEIEAAGGVNISELNLKVLEKVEELTLYTLGQEEALKAQASLIDELRAEIEALKAN